MGHLGQRVHAGIGAAGASQVEDLRARPCEGGAQLSRHGACVLLLLPAVVARALVLEDQAVGMRLQARERPGTPASARVRCSSPVSYISVRMSQPPTSFPPMNTWGMVGQLE